MPLRDRFLSLVPIEGFETRYASEISQETFFGFPLAAIVSAEENLRSSQVPSIAYFSMEYGLSATTYNAMTRTGPISPKNESESHRVFSNLRAMDYYLVVEAAHRLDLPIYSGGLGVLAGDTLKSASDRGVSLVAVGILWNEGYFHQNFWFKDGQMPQADEWDPATYPGLIPLSVQVAIELKKETVHLRLWKYMVYSVDRTHVVPLVLLDSNVESNSPSARVLTSQLYRSDNAHWKLMQRTILGIGGMKALAALDYRIERFHLNEGHAALASLEWAKGRTDAPIEEDPKAPFVYTCHTPVAAGHDRFPLILIQEMLGSEACRWLSRFGQDVEDEKLINFTLLAMNTSRQMNAVSKKHTEITRLQFPHIRDRIHSITNGVHLPTWISQPVASVLDRFTERIGDWRRQPESLRNVQSLVSDSDFRRGIWDAHQTNKQLLCQLLKRWNIQPHAFTLAWARRIAAYKRPSLILHDVERLLAIARKVGPIQLLVAGKAHPNDDLGFTHINEMLSAIDGLESHRDDVRVVMLENYDTYIAKLLVSSVDVWLNTPLPPFEASGTSGMKAIANGVLQLSTLDGWMVEAAQQPVGWIFGWQHKIEEPIDERNLRLTQDAASLYEVLEEVVGLYYQTHIGDRVVLESEWVTRMITAIAAASVFNTDRMVAQYETNIWGLRPVLP